MKRKILSLFLVVCMISSLFTALPMSAAAESNSCGDNLIWHFADGVLSITGSGDMTDYTEEELAPWAEYMDEISIVEISSGITSIGDNAFPADYFAFDYVIFGGTSAEWNNIYIGEANEAITDTFIDYKLCIVTFMDFEGNIFNEQIVEKGGYAEDPGQPSILGGNFIGWDMDFSYVEFDMMINPMMEPGGMPDFPMISYPVIFMDDEGNIIEEQWIETGMSATEPTPPEKEGYTFVGWDSYDFQCVMSELTITAIYEPVEMPIIPYTVTFDAVGGACDVENMEVISGETYGELPVPTYENYTFCGWFDAEIGGKEITADTIVDLTDNQTLYARWLLRSGTAGATNNLSWVVYTNGDMYISGEGAMNNFSYLHEDRVPWRSVKSNIKNVVIESGVTNIGNYAFKSSGVQSISIPDTVTYIGDEAFAHCSSLKSITLPESLVTIDGSAFEYSGITSIHIPAATTSVSGIILCTALTEITVDENNKTFCSVDGVLYNKNKTELISYPSAKADTEYKVLDGVTSIANSAFYNSRKLTSITLPDGLTTIGYGAFRVCLGLVDIKIPDTVTSIRSNAFESCKALTEITIPESVTTMEGYVFSGCTGLKKATVIANITKMGTQSFYKCSKLETVTLPETLTEISSEMFSNCVSLSTIKLPEKLETIGGKAFYNCTGLTEIVIPKTVINIYSEAFSSCKALKEITIENGVQSIGSNAFLNCMSITEINLPASVLNVYSSAFRGCSALSNINVDEKNTSLISVNGVLFDKNKTTLLCYPAAKTDTSYTVPETVTSISDYAFYNCTGLKSVAIPKSVTSFGSGAFSGCTGITDIFYAGTEEEWLSISNVYFPTGTVRFETCFGGTCSESVSWLLYNSGELVIYGEGAIPSYSSTDPAPWLQYDVNKVTVENGITAIGANAFNGYGNSFYNIEKVTIPESVAQIGAGAFGNSPKLSEINIDENNLYYCVEDGVLYNKDKTSLIQYPAAKQNTEFVVPDTVTNIESAAFAFSVNLKNITIPQSVVVIADGAFASSGIESIVLPEGINKISIATFVECSSLKSVTVPESVRMIGRGAFDLCNALTDVYYNGSSKQWSEINISGDNEAIKNATIHYGAFVVSFYSKGMLMSEQNVKAGEAAIAPELKTLTGEKFVGWDQDFSNVTQDLKVNAIYEPISSKPDSFTVTFDANEGVCEVENKTVWEYGVYGDLPVPTREGYTFNGWFTEKTGGTKVTADTKVEITQDQTLYAQWTFSSSGGDTEKEVVANGGCGINVTWTLYSNGELIVDGYGDMTDFESDKEVPWYQYRDLIINITINIGVKSVGDYAFSYCSNLVNVNLSLDMTNIGEHAFSYCILLVVIVIPDSVTDLEDYSFYGCINLENIDLSESLVIIGVFVFGNCSSLPSVTIPSTVTSVGSGAFSGCTELKNVIIIAIIIVIGDGAFDNCSGLTSIDYSGTKDQWNSVLTGSNINININININCSNGTGNNSPDNPGGGSGNEGGNTGGGSGNEGGNSGSGGNEGSEDGSGDDNTGEDETDINKVTVSKETASSGEEVTVTVKASENIGAAVGTMLINYDREMLELIDTSFGEMLENTSSIVNADYNYNGATKLYASFVGTENITAGGNLLTMTFKVNDEAEHDAVIPVTIDDIKFYSADESLIELETVNGEVHVVNYELGDVSKNDVIDLIDVLRIMQYDVGLRTFDKTELRLADVNRDDSVNIIDALMVQKFDAGLITKF